MKLPEKNTEGEFVIHEHRAKKLHWDLRLEVPATEDDFEIIEKESYRKLGFDIKKRETVMWSFAVPKAKFPKKGEKLLLIETEPHPVEYNSFEGVIPEKMYGAGEVKIYDKGKIKWIDVNPKKIKFEMIGEKIRAIFSIVRFAKEEKKWLWLLEEQVS